MFSNSVVVWIQKKIWGGVNKSISVQWLRRGTTTTTIATPCTKGWILYAVVDWQFVIYYLLFNFMENNCYSYMSLCCTHFTSLTLSLTPSLVRCQRSKITSKKYFSNEKDFISTFLDFSCWFNVTAILFKITIKRQLRIL